MAKKVISPQTVVEQWKEVTQRASLSSYYNVNGTLVSKNNKGKILLVVMDIPLLALILADKDIDVKEFDISDPETKEYRAWFEYGSKLDGDGWLSLVDDTGFYDGKVIEIVINGHDFPVIISKELLPLKLKKAEFEMVEYRVFTDPGVLAIRKRYQPLENHGFTIMRLFQII